MEEGKVANLGATETQLDNKPSNKETTVIKPELLAYDPKIKGVTEAQLEYISRDDCKYCHGRGYERWLSGRIKHPDGSTEEQFEDRQCRCIRIKVVNS